jgi:hypothetical protein
MNTPAAFFFSLCSALGFLLGSRMLDYGCGIGGIDTDEGLE